MGRCAQAWADRWASFRLLSPRWTCALPGLPYEGPDPDGHPSAAEVEQWLSRCRTQHGLPVLEGTPVTSCRPLSLRRPGADGYEVETPAGTWTCDQVVVATGAASPRVPAVAALLPSDVVQLHASGYRSPGRLPDGDVLVVGAGQSGTEIATELARAGRRTSLCVGEGPQVPLRYRGRDVVAWWHEMGARDRADPDLPGGVRCGDLRDLADQGIRLCGRLVGARPAPAGTVLELGTGLAQTLRRAAARGEAYLRAVDAWIAARGVPAPSAGRRGEDWDPGRGPDELLASRDDGIRSVVWATGATHDLAWLDPVLQAQVSDSTGRPRSDRGLTAASGLYVLGAPGPGAGAGGLPGLAREVAALAPLVAARALVDASLEAAPAWHVRPARPAGARTRVAPAV